MKFELFYDPVGRLVVIICLAILAIGAIALYKVAHPITPACIRSHVEINNVPEYTRIVCDNPHGLTYCPVYTSTVIPAEHQETLMCDEYAKEESK